MDGPLLAITAAPLDLARLIDRVVAEHQRRRTARDAPGVGAIATFLGSVRDRSRGRIVQRLEYEAYEPLALQVFDRIASECAAEWPDVVLGLHHRIGSLDIGEVSVAVVAACPHRAQAFAACRYGMERVKQIAPIWKREVFQGGESWVEGASMHPDDRVGLEEARRVACVSE
jgi:molybdopterin synthase catalytic subunit